MQKLGFWQLFVSKHRGIRFQNLYRQISRSEDVVVDTQSPTFHFLEPPAGRHVHKRILGVCWAHPLLVSVKGFRWDARIVFEIATLNKKGHNVYGTSLATLAQADGPSLNLVSSRLSASDRRPFDGCVDRRLPRTT